MNLQQLLDTLDQYESRIPLDVLEDSLNRVEITCDCVKDQLIFDEGFYQRNLLHDGPAYQALVICWLNGQRSLIHDHVGSSCGVKVLRGTATETVFDWSDNRMIYPTRTSMLNEGCVCAAQDMDIHQISNLQADNRDLVTLHIYSPRLVKMGVYSLTDSKVTRQDEYKIASNA
ncbi:cysteine dioxygenase family protein [bacterium]|nr:cysteine dioxygenase family protein [bacterium]